jgi:lipopolysaccharide transport system permease protein
MMLVFVFLFGHVFRMRLPGAQATQSYATWLIGGYAPWLATSEALLAATSSVIGAANLVKNVSFKTELLPLAAVLSSLVTLAVTLTVLVVSVALESGLGWHAVLIVPVFAVHYLMLIGLGLMLAALAVFFRDITQVLPNVFMLILLTSPILYPLESMPRLLQLAGLANPFYIVCDAYRQVLVHQRIPDPWPLFAVAAGSAIFTIFALRLFRRAKGHFEAYL